MLLYLVLLMKTQLLLHLLILMNLQMLWQLVVLQLAEHCSCNQLPGLRCRSAKGRPLRCNHTRAHIVLDRSISNQNRKMQDR